MSKDSYFITVRSIILFLFNIPYDVASFIAAQSCLETGFGSSNIFKENHNLFGMKFPKKRLTCATGVNRNHAVYNDMNHSIHDYFLWCQYFGFTQDDFDTVGKFMLKLKSSPYNSKPSYVASIYKIYEKYVLLNP